ncbi:MAG: glycosyltransferase [Ferruginibacter sp.]
MKNVLWLTSWYPNRMDNFDGDFIQRHARAVSGFCKVHVIYVVKIKDKLTQPGVEEKLAGNLTEQIIYYKPIQTGIKLLDKFLSQQKYNNLYRKAITTYINTKGKPGCVHVHVALKAGLAALWAKKKWNIPFIVTEHSTVYLPEADERIENFSALYQNWLLQIMKKASLVTVVSDQLGKAIQKYFPFVNYIVLPNVVDTSIFFSVPKQVSNDLQLIHVSNMNYQKNTEAILQAMQLLKQNNVTFKMELFGPANAALHEMIISLGLQNHVTLKGEVLQPELAKAMQRSDVLVLYSRYETFGCVLIEANACGIPVIVSDIEVFHELIQEGNNGIFVQGNDPVALAEKLTSFSMQENSFDKNTIAETTAAKYNFDKVGQQFVDLYNKVSS